MLWFPKKKIVRFRMAIGPDGLRWGFTSMVPDALPALPGRQWQRAGGGARLFTLARAGVGVGCDSGVARRAAGAAGPAVAARRGRRTLLHACTRMAFAYRRRPRPCKAAAMAGPAALSPPCHRLSLPVSRITLTQGRKTGDYCRLAGG